MTLTILLLLAAIALFLFAGKIVNTEGKDVAPIMHLAKKGVKLLSVILLIIGVNRTGFGTKYYMVDGNPGILQVMVQNMQAGERERQAREQERVNREVPAYVKSHGDEMQKWAPILGNPNATKTIYVFSAADCPYCRRVHGEFVKLLAEDKDVKIVVKNFPVHGEISDIPGRWVIAAKLQGNDKAVKLYEKIMANEYWAPDRSSASINANIEKYAKSVSGLDVAKLKKDLSGEAVSGELAQVSDLVQKFNVTGTPFLIIGNKVVPGYVPVAEIKNALK